MYYLTVDDVIHIHVTELEENLLRDSGPLESAVMAPQQSAFGEDAYHDIHEKAAALMRGVAANHAFIDGKKRTAVLSMIAFYGLNGYLLYADQMELIHLTVDIVVEHLPVEKIADHLRVWAIEIEDPAE